MGIINSFKSMVGSGAPEVKVSLKNFESPVGGFVKGIVIITGGDYETKIDQLDMYLLRKEDLKDKKEAKEVSTKLGRITYNNYNLIPKEEISIPFQVEIPKNALTTSQAMTNFIKISLDISGKDSFGMTEVKII
jgi:sporulation-control protein spo0M